MLQRAYSVLEVKAFDDEKRIIEGVASTPSTDRQGDVLEAVGVKFALPLPFLWQHQKDQPIGHVISASVKPDGIRVRVQLAQDDEPGPLKDLLDLAWRSIKKGLVRGLSVGFRPTKEPEPIKGSWGLRFSEWEMLELSAVTIPANSEATITAVKQFDAAHAVTGTARRPARLTPPGVPGASAVSRNQKPQGGDMFTSRIRELQAEKATKEAQMKAVAGKSATEGRTMDDGEQEAFDGLLQDIGAIDSDIGRYQKAQESLQAAVPVEKEPSREAAARSRAGTVQVARSLPKGTAFTRYAMALCVGRGNISDAMRHAKRWERETPEVLQFLEKADVGTTTDSDWAAPLVYAQNLVSEFIELLRPATVIGRLTGLRNVPFKVRIPRQTGGSTVNWVGENAVKPTAALAFDTVTLDHHKAAGIVVLTEELVKLSSPAAEETVRRDLVAQMAQFLDEQFLLPTVAAASTNPAAITNGITPIASTGDDAAALEADLFNAFAPFDDSDTGEGNIYIIMQPKTARSIALMRPDIGNGRLYPELSPRGGSLLGYPVITSNSVPNGFIIIVKADEVLIADDGSVALDASREATLDMAGGGSPNISLWQKNLVAIRAERGITWARKRDEGVSLISGAYYGAATVAES